MTDGAKHPDLGKLAAAMLGQDGRLRLSALLRDNFTCQVDRAYRPTATLSLLMIVPAKKGGRRNLNNVVTVNEKYFKAARGQESPFSEDDLALIASNTAQWRLQFPSIDHVLDEYVRLIQEEHRLARIFYFRAFNEALRAEQKEDKS